jgi:hypothetical protein
VDDRLRLSQLIKLARYFARVLNEQWCKRMEGVVLFLIAIWYQLALGIPIDKIL